MNKKTKIALSFLGVSAVVVPAILLVFVSSRMKEVPEVPNTNRPVEIKNLEESVRKTAPSPILLPSSTPTPILEGSPSANP